MSELEILEYRKTDKRCQLCGYARGYKLVSIDGEKKWICGNSCKKLR